MFAYLIMIGVPILYAMSQPVAKTLEKYQKKQKIILVLFFAIYFSLLALRHDSIGTDADSYVHNFFNVYGHLSWKQIFSITHQEEPAFAYLCKLIYSVWSNSQFFLAVTSFVIVFPVAFLYIRESENALISISLFLSSSLFVMFFTGLRQSIAVAMMAPIYYSTKNKKLILYLICVGIAYLFHVSALVILPFYFIYHARVNKNWLLVIVPGLTICYIFNKQLFLFALQFLGPRYVESYGEIVATGAYSMLLLYIIFAIYAFLIPETNRMDSDTIGLRNILLFSIILQSFAPLNNMAMRMNYYYMLFYPLLIPKIANRAKSRNIQIAKVSRIVICLFFFLYFICTIGSSGSLNVFPYIPFWRTP